MWCFIGLELKTLSQELPLVLFYFLIHLILVCPAGFYGMNCSKECECRGNPCHPVSGMCFCPPGLTGQHCQKGMFGFKIS